MALNKIGHGVAPLTPMEQRFYHGLVGQGRLVVTTRDAQTLLAISASHAAKLLHDMYHKGAVARVGRGRYVLSDPAQFSASVEVRVDALAILDDLMRHLDLPYYVGYGTAAFVHGLADQVPFHVAVAVPHWRRPIQLRGTRISFHQVSHEALWGAQRIPYRNTYLTASDAWRTLLDCASRLDLVGGIEELEKIVREAVKRPAGSPWASPPKDYGARFGDPAALQRLGYLFKLHGAEPGTALHTFQESLRPYRGPYVILLDPKGPVQGRIEAEWGVRDNVPRRRLQVA